MAIRDITSRIAAAHAPPDWWRVEHDYSFTEARGRTDFARGIVYVPRPTTRARLHTYLHEIGHIALHALAQVNARPLYQLELEADAYSARIFQAHGLDFTDTLAADVARYHLCNILEHEHRTGETVDRAVVEAPHIRDALAALPRYLDPVFEVLP